MSESTPFKAIYLPPSGTSTPITIHTPYTPLPTSSQSLIRVSHSLINPATSATSTWP